MYSEILFPTNEGREKTVSYNRWHTASALSLEEKDEAMHKGTAHTALQLAMNDLRRIQPVGGWPG